MYAQDVKIVGQKSAHDVYEGDWRDCGLRKRAVDAFKSQRPREDLPRQKQATIDVTYSSDFPTEAIDAYERAVDIWEAHIDSPIPIRIEADVINNPDDNVLGGTIPNEFWVLRNDAGEQFIVGDALADLLVGRDLGDEETSDNNPPDMLTDFNFDRDDWHFGEGDAPSGEIDFTTVALHEIGHGLHYLSLCTYNSGEGKCWRDLSDGSRAPGIYSMSLFEEQGDGSLAALTDTTEFDDPSTELGDALTGDALVFEGAEANEGADRSTGPIPPKIYAPSAYNEGSSLSHLDEFTYPTGEENALMTPQINTAETVRLPGPVACGQLKDIGWTPGPGCIFGNVSVVAAQGAAEGDQSNRRRTVRLQWDLEGDSGTASRIDNFVIEQQEFVGSNMLASFDSVKTVEANGLGEYETVVEDVQVGTHRFRVGSDITPATEFTVTVEAQRPEISVYPNPFTDQAQVSVVVTERQRVRLDVYDAVGRHVGTPFVGTRAPDTASPMIFDSGQVPNLASGVYFFRVRGEGFAEVQKALHVK